MFEPHHCPSSQEGNSFLMRQPQRHCTLEHPQLGFYSCYIQQDKPRVGGLLVREHVWIPQTQRVHGRTLFSQGVDVKSQGVPFPFIRLFFRTP